MNILITNDDGYQAPGLLALHQAMASFGRVSVAAPTVEKSMCSHGIQLRHPIRVDEVDHPEMGCIYSVDAWPSDCVRLALSCLLDHRPDWVISGINNGANVGVDVFYSGTVAGAREAAIHDIPSVSFSHLFNRQTEIDWTRAAQMAADVFAKLLTMPRPKKSFWNVTFPHAIRSISQSGSKKQRAADVSLGAIPEMVFCPVSTDAFPLIYRREENPDATLFPTAPRRRHIRYCGEYMARPRTPGTDVDVLFSGKFAVSKICLDGNAVMGSRS